MAQQIATIRCDLDLKNRIFRKERRNRLADLCVRRQNQKAVAVFGEAKLARAAKHSLGFDPAKFARLNLEIIRQDRAGKGEGNLVPDLVVLRAANNLAGLPASIVHLANAQSI